MSTLRLAWAMAGALALAGCSDDGDDKTPPAVSKCNLLAETWCEQGLTCLVDLGMLQQSDYQPNDDACVRTAEAAVPCTKAVGAKSTFDQCLLDITAMPCSTWDVPESELSSITVPATCSGVILVSP